jgi:hemolysin activation/secretion protein
LLATRVQTVVFSGNDHVTAAELLRVVAPRLGRELSRADMEQLAQAIQAYYRKRGFMLAQAYLPPQTIDGGRLRIAVLEGRYSDVTIGSNRSRMPDDAILRTFLAAACHDDEGCKGKVILRETLESAGVRVSEIPGLTATYELKPGAEPGSTSVVLTAEPLPRFSGSVSGDNEGYASTGRDRLNLAANAAGLSPFGDLTAVSATYSGKGLFSFVGDTSVLGGYSGLRLGATGSHVRYALGGDFTALGATGLADAGGLYGSYALQRSLRGSVDLRLDLQAKAIQSDIGASDAHSREGVQEAVLSLSGSRLDSLLRSGSTQFRLTYTYGSLNLEDEQSRAFDAATARTGGHFGKFSYAIRREEVVVPGWTLFGALSGQIANKNLDPSEKFSLTGPQAVRAYASGEASSDVGELLTLESRFGLPQDLIPGHQLTVAAFYDRAWARFNVSDWDGYAGARGADFAGGGAYVSLVRPDRYSLRAIWAYREGTASHSPAQSNQQVWLEAAAAF